MEEKKITIKVAHKDGETTVENEHGVGWKFGGKMMPETVLASITFQTIYIAFKDIINNSDNFEIELSMKHKIND